MADLLDRCVEPEDICIFRGNTSPLIFDLKDSAGVAFDGTGRVYTLTVDTLEEPPTPSVTEVFNIVGVVATTQVSFSPLAADVADELCNFYEIDETDTSGKKLTIAKGAFEIKQNIDKSA